MCSVLFWVLFGWLADYSFPFGQALELLLSCFTGTVAAKINSLQQQLQRTDVIPQPDNTKQVQKLNNLESQAWLYKGILERLGANSSANHERVAKTIEALEYKRSEILQVLESVATNPKISVQEWKQISNQGDYAYVKGYVRNGKWVNEYYRRPRRRQVK